MTQVVEEKSLSLQFDEKVCVFSDQVSGAATDRSRHNTADDSSSDGKENISKERPAFWESQEALLQEILERYVLSSVKLRQGIDRIIEQAKHTNVCCCKTLSDGCISCLRKTVVDLLCQNGYKAKLRTSKWKNTPKIPGGSHEYIQVIASTQGRKKQIPILIELELRDQFEIVKACDEYQNLVSQLPEYYIGKAEHLNAVISVLCDVSKQSMKEKKLHRGPWRKRSFIQMKWSSLEEGDLIDGCLDDKTSVMPSVRDQGSRLLMSATPAVMVVI